jgi:hypothetical protein
MVPGRSGPGAFPGAAGTDLCRAGGPDRASALDGSDGVAGACGLAVAESTIARVDRAGAFEEAADLASSTSPELHPTKATARTAHQSVDHLSPDPRVDERGRRAVNVQMPFVR